MEAKSAIDQLEQAAAPTGPGGWSAELITVGRLSMRSVLVKDRRGCIDFIETLVSLLEKTKRRRPNALQQSGVLRVSTQGPTKLLSEQIAVWMDDLTRRSRSHSARKGYAHTLSLLLAVAGDIPVSKVNQDHVRLVWDYIRWTPRNPRGQIKYRGLTAQELYDLGKKEGGPAPSAHVYNAHWRHLRSFFNNLVKGKVLLENPLQGLEFEIDTTAEPKIGRDFTRPELDDIFNPGNFLPWALKYPHRFWVPQLALYTGARVGELSQLKVRDVQFIGGRWVLSIQKTFDDIKAAPKGPRTCSQNAKSSSAIRLIPIAKPLLDAGFLDYVEDIRATKHPRLFPHLGLGRKRNGESGTRGYGIHMADQFSSYAKKLGIEQGVAMHAFRHTFTTGLKNAHVPDSVAAALIGHRAQIWFPALGVYQHHGVDVPIEEMANELAKFNPPVKLFPYQRGLFSEQLKNGWRFEL